VEWLNSWEFYPSPAFTEPLRWFRLICNGDGSKLVDEGCRTDKSGLQAVRRDYLERIERGEPVNREEFISRHAEIVNALRSFIAAVETREVCVASVTDA